MRDPQASEETLVSLRLTAQALARAAASGMDAAWAGLLSTACALTGMRHAALWQRDPGSGELVLLSPKREPAPRLQVDGGRVGACAASGQVQSLRDAPGLAAIGLDVLAGGGRERGGATVCVPLLSGERVLGVLQLLGDAHAEFDATAEQYAELLAALAALAMQRVGSEAGMALHSEVEVAREIQRGSLPTAMPEVPGYDLHGHFQPATYAGGDMLDVVQLSEGVFLLLGDATGHGFGPALSAMEMQGMLRVAFRAGAGLDGAYRHVNNQLTEDLPDDRFITAFMGLLDPARHGVRYHCAGQGPLLHFRAADGQCAWLQPTTFPVGVMELTEAPAAAILQLAPGDILALISDGLYERLDADNNEFGQQRVAEVIAAGQHLPMAELGARLLAAADAFAAGVAAVDDVTMVLVRRLPDGVSSAT